jgi:uncharacterized protein YjbI with pentapeptide repeats
MKSLLQPLTLAMLTSLLATSPIRAENLDQLSQLLATKRCPGCDLSGAGLVMANLSGANLAHANLAGANLSQANLSGANLVGANLSGASLNRANLSGANLSGAILQATDLREAFLSNAILSPNSLGAAYVQGAKGIPSTAGTPEQFYGWGVLETRKGNYKAALDYYNQSLLLDESFAPAYLGRGLVLFRLGNEEGANLNTEMASKLFKEQKNTSGYDASQNFQKNLQAIKDSRENQQGSANLDKIVLGIAPILMKFVLPLAGL